MNHTAENQSNGRWSHIVRHGGVFSLVYYVDVKDHVGRKNNHSVLPHGQGLDVFGGEWCSVVNAGPAQPVKVSMQRRAPLFASRPGKGQVTDECSKSEQYRNSVWRARRGVWTGESLNEAESYRRRG